MASVLGLPEARKKRVREEIARLQEEAQRVEAALGEADRELQRLVDARVTVTEVPDRAAFDGHGADGKCGDGFDGAPAGDGHGGDSPRVGLPGDLVGAGV